MSAIKVPQKTCPDRLSQWADEVQVAFGHLSKPQVWSETLTTPRKLPQPAERHQRERKREYKRRARARTAAQPSPKNLHLKALPASLLLLVLLTNRLEKSGERPLPVALTDTGQV